ncbi:MAG: hypothetical protein JJT89_03315, partial [Nitriliruptoraceae bacterium]|nr:hypothetical protein [Nitriliruptoraceae bacterium]
MTRDWRAGMAADPLPVDAVLDRIVAHVRDHRRLVLEAPPGAGKTTRVPLALLDADPPGRIVVLEPRRVAARAAAARLAAQLGEPVGQTVGVTTREDRRTSRATRIELVTDGIVLRRLQRDPGLAGTGVLVFDEFHERRLDADLALAFAWETRGALRDDLALVVASATLPGARIAALLDDAPIVRAEGRTFPVATEHRDRVDVRALPEEAARTVVEVLDDPATTGDVLVFLPGVREIGRATRALAGITGTDVVVLALHGRLSGDEQDRALRPDPQGRRKVVLATDVAESSLTIDGIRVVVDAGRSREPRFDPATGMGGLVTVPASRASATQRAGRAGRTAPGRVVRLWPAREHAGRDAAPRPAIATDDLTAAALEVAAWGAEVAELALLDQPPDAAWEGATATLRELGAIDGAGRITAHGRLLADLPVHPRVGHLLIHARDRGTGRLGTELAAVLGDRDPLATSPTAPCADLAARVRVLRGGQAPPGTRVRRAALAPA